MPADSVPALISEWLVRTRTVPGPHHGLRHVDHPNLAAAQRDLQHASLLADAPGSFSPRTRSDSILTHASWRHALQAAAAAGRLALRSTLRRRAFHVRDRGVAVDAPAHPVDGETLGRMRDTMTHRGPDGAGLWVAPGREVALAFRRLAIVDLSTTANQPMTNEDGKRPGRLQRRDLQPPRAAPGTAGEGPPLQDRPLRHRGDRPRLRGVGRGRRRAPPRDVRDRDLGRRAAPAVPGARPRRDQAALLLVDPRRLPVRLGDQGAARASGR